MLDSDPRSSCAACPHGAFPLPEQEDGAPLRESIDLRLLVAYADIEYPGSEE